MSFTSKSLRTQTRHVVSQYLMVGTDIQHAGVKCCVKTQKADCVLDSEIGQSKRVTSTTSANKETCRTWRLVMGCDWSRCVARGQQLWTSPAALKPCTSPPGPSLWAAGKRATELSIPCSMLSIWLGGSILLSACAPSA